MGPGYLESGYVLVDEPGQPWQIDGLRRAAYRLMLMALAGIPQGCSSKFPTLGGAEVSVSGC